MPDPTFLLIGAPKCGTSWLASMLRQHPQVGMSREKELHFFDRSARFSRGLDWYRAQFPEAVARGEATPSYLAGGRDRKSCLGLEEQSCARVIREHYPDLRLLVLLREPVSRAVSGYTQSIRMGRISPRRPFSIRDETRDIVEIGCYDLHLARWFELYDRDRIRIMIFEEAVADDRRGALRETFRFLGVDDGFVPGDVDERVNPAPSHLGARIEHAGRRWARVADGRGKDRLARRIDRRTRRFRKRVERILPDRLLGARRWEIEFSAEARLELAELYAPHNRRLEEMLGRPPPWGGAGSS